MYIMESNIDIKQLKNHFFSPNLKLQPEILALRTKITNVQFFSKNEILIGEKIRKIPYYSKDFLVLQSYEQLNFAELSGLLNKQLADSNMQYILLKYDDKDVVNFHEFLYSFISIKKLIMFSIDNLIYLLNSLQRLDENNICFFDLSPQKIGFKNGCGEKPLLMGFQMSLSLNHLTPKYILNILEKVGDYTYLPIEIQFLYYIETNELTTISYSYIEDFCEHFIKNLFFLQYFSDGYKKSYYENSVKFLKQYINKSKEEIINDILERNDKWDIYSISVLFFHIFGCIVKVFSLKGTLINKILLELSKNFHPDSVYRNSLQSMIEKLNKLLNNLTDYDLKFIHTLTDDGLNKLFDELSK